MLPLLKQFRVEHKAKILPNGITPVTIEWGMGGNPARITFSDGGYALGSCIRCYSPPCIEYLPFELELEVFQDFPADKNNNVCPTSAISWPQASTLPVIEEELCISCGICVSRCPTRAIYLDGSSAQINDTPNEYFVIQNTPSTHEITIETANKFIGIAENGFFLYENDNLIGQFREKFENVAMEQSAQFPNHLARNLLITVGVGAAMRRRGDVNIRMDLVLGPPGVEQGTSEVELGAEVLDAPRNILDNIAVLVARYELSKNEIVPLIVSLELPNLRSEYWQFIKDVKSVLDIKINSITIGALIILTWNRAKLSFRTGEELYVDIDTVSLKPKIENIIGRELNIKTEGYPGFLASSK